MLSSSSFWPKDRLKEEPRSGRRYKSAEDRDTICRPQGSRPPSSPSEEQEAAFFRRRTMRLQTTAVHEGNLFDCYFVLSFPSGSTRFSPHFRPVISTTFRPVLTLRKSQVGLWRKLKGAGGYWWIYGVETGGNLRRIRHTWRKKLGESAVKYPSLGSAQSTQQIRQKAWRLDAWLAQQKEGRGTNFGAFLHT